MDKRVLIICRGIQGSGKSTWAKQWCHEDPEHRVRFNNDDIRNMLGDYWGPICKKKLYEDNIKGKFYIPFVLEDNCKCVEMWRNEGLICLQPNEGKF